MTQTSKYANMTKVTSAKANDMWETAVFYNNELCYLTSGLKAKVGADVDSLARQIADFKSDASILADCINDMYSNVKSVQAVLDATKLYCLNLLKKY